MPVGGPCGKMRKRSETKLSAVIDWDRVELNGWAPLECDVGGSKNLAELGTDICSRFPLVKDGEVRSLPVRESALRKSFSKEYGTGSFPFHTDGAFMEVPPRYLLMSVTGDCRRSTSVLRFIELFEAMGRDTAELAQRAVWMLTGGLSPRYTSIYSKMGFSRFDPLCMRPANRSARMFMEQYESVEFEKLGAAIDWSLVSAALIDNWATLHSRGKRPPGEGERVLHRIYLKGI